MLRKGVHMKNTNEVITISAGPPSLRAGWTVSTQTSKRYAVQAMHDLMEIIRQFNEEQNQMLAEKDKPESTSA